MKLMRISFFTAILASGMLSAEPLYNVEGTDPSFAAILESSGGKPGERFNRGGAPGSSIDVNNELLEKQVGKTGPIPDAISIHTELSGGISRKDFGKWTRWYQEDGNIQVFRLFQGEQNVRSGAGKDGSQGRIEAFTPGIPVAPGTWHEWEGTYTVIKPLGANIFQLMHEGKDSKGDEILWPFHIMMTGSGDITFNRRRAVAGLEQRIVIAENMVGRSISIKVRANGSDYEVYQKSPIGEDPWKPVTKGTYTKAKDKIGFRWGMYVGSKKGESVPNDGLLFVTGVSIR